MLLQGGAEEAVRVREALRASTLPHADDTMLLRVEDATLPETEVTSGHVTSGQRKVRSGQVRSAQVRSGEGPGVLIP